MSGPKVINIEAIRRRQQLEWLTLRTRLLQAFSRFQTAIDNAPSSLSDSILLPTEERMLADLEALASQGRMEELLDAANARLSFFISETESLQRSTRDYVFHIDPPSPSASQESRDALLDRLRAADREAPDPELQRSLAQLQGPEPPAHDTAARLQHRRSVLNAQVALIEHDKRTRLAEAARALGLNPVAHPIEVHTGAHGTSDAAFQGILEQIRRLKADLAAQGASDLLQQVQRNLNDIQHQPDPQRKQLLLDSLREEMAIQLQRRRKVALLSRRLDELDARLSPFASQTQPLQARIAQARMSDDPPLDQLRADVEQAVRDLTAEHLNRAAREAVVQALQALGYHLWEGMATLRPGDTSTILTSPLDRSYGVKIDSLASGEGMLRTRLVRLGGGGTPPREQALRDTEMERLWCQHHTRMLDTLRQDNLRPFLQAKREPGEEPLELITAPSREDTRSSASTGSHARAREQGSQT